MTLIGALAAVLFGIAVATPYPNLRTYVTDCKSLAYQEYGTGKPIVLLAGGPGMNPAYMVPVAKMLASGGRRVLLLHQRGTGMSADAVSCRDRMNLAGAIADLEAFREYLHLGKLTIAGHSWGGMLAMAYAQKYPDRVAGLLLLDTGPMNDSGSSTESAIIHARLSPEERAALQQARGTPQIDAIEEKAYFADPGKVGLLQESIPSGEPMWYETVGQLIGPDLGKFDVVEGMRNLKAPVTLVFGRFDPGFYIAGQIRDLHPNSRLIVVEHAGHYSWLENPGKTAATLKAIAAEMP
ncbi:MAG TPA: alpha/beta fold hydrolase [Terriglobales bacterium]|nr:alpha/beta fold hydrolase [Terriglobales bacterium]